MDELWMDGHVVKPVNADDRLAAFQAALMPPGSGVRADDAPAAGADSLHTAPD